MNTVRRLSIFCTCLLSVSLLASGPTLATEVTVDKNDQGHFVLKRDGKPYYIYGAGGSDHLRELVECGGNSIRTWGIESLEKQIDGKPLLDYCQELGISVSVGIWIEHERHGFDYSDPKQVQKQRQAVRQAVRQYMDHPAILMWGLGNEMEGPESDSGAERIWKELNELAAIIKSEDSDHPVMTVIAGASAAKIRGILEHYRNIDVLGVNSYGAASSVASDIKAAGWNKPFALTEFGPSGHWEVPQTSWGAAIEPSSRAKAASYYVTQSMLTEDAGDICVGSYCFLWGQKQEKTSTWYGMFLPSGEKLPQVDAMCRAWTGHWPENRCPKVTRVESELTEATVAAGALFEARVQATDPDEDPLEWTWYVQAETTERSVGGDRESVPPLFPECVVRAKEGEAVIRTPNKPGNYRLFIIVRDGQGNASADNICFRVSAN